MATGAGSWPDGRPRHPVSVPDWSCYGSLGWTLCQALDEMEDEDEPEADEEGTAIPPDQSSITAASIASPVDHDNSGAGNGSTSSVQQESQPNFRDFDNDEHEHDESSCVIQTTPALRQAVLAALAEETQQHGGSQRKKSAQQRGHQDKNKQTAMK